MGRWVWRAYAALCLVLLPLPLFPGQAPTMTAFVVLGLLCPLAVATALRQGRSRSRPVFRLFLIAACTWVVGDLLDVVSSVTGIGWHVGNRLVGSHITVDDAPPFTFGDFVHYLGQPLTAAGAILLARARSTGQDKAEIIDALIVTVSVALVYWVVLIHPTLTAHEAPLSVRAAILMAPVADLIMLAGCSRLLVQPGVAGNPSLFLLIGAGTMMAVSDGLTTLRQIEGLGGTRVEATILLVAMMLFMAAMIHPSVKNVAYPSAQPVSPFSWARFAGLAVGCAAVPVTMLGNLTYGESSHGGWAYVLASSAVGALVMLRLVLMIRQLERQSMRLRMLARTDHLTGLANRRTAETELARAATRCKATGSPLTVAMIDFDHFKDYNDTHGHQAGDQLLAAAAVVWSARLHADETLARFGGEEFLLLSPRSPSELVRLTDQLRKVTPAGQSFSAGVAGWGRSESIAQLLARADAALYTAKEGGRRRTVVAAPAGRPPTLSYSADETGDAALPTGDKV